MTKKESGFTMIELMIVILIMGVIAAFSIPGALVALKGYRLHADAASIASFYNVARMKSASQYAPYRLEVNIAGGTFFLEQLCGVNQLANAACTVPGATAYTQLNPRAIDKLGTQPVSTGNSFLSCRPAGVTAFPGLITADPAGCPATPPAILDFYFNTRGLPVGNLGSPLTQGGAVLYLQNQNNLLDAITVSIGGRVTVWNWVQSTGQWAMR